MYQSNKKRSFYKVKMVKILALLPTNYRSIVKLPTFLSLNFHCHKGKYNLFIKIFEGGEMKQYI